MTKFYWHIHHDTLLEPLTEPLKNRIDYIKENKPKEEIALRLKLLKPVKGKLSKELVEAGKKCDEAGKKYNEARKKYDEAGKKCDEAGKKYNEERKKYDEERKKYDEAGKKYEPQLEALHKKECPNCTWDGKTIFPDK